MKKGLVSAAVAALFMANFAHAGDVSTEIQISGKVLPDNSSCTVVVSETAITIPDVAINQLVVEGESGVGPARLNLKLVDTNAPDKDCDDMENVAYRFSGQATNTGVLTNTLSGDNAAEGVGVQLYSMTDDRVIQANGGPISSSERGISLDLVRLKDGTSVKAGSVQASLTIEVARL